MTASYCAGMEKRKVRDSSNTAIVGLHRHNIGASAQGLE